MKKNNDTKDYSEQLKFLNSRPYYANKKIVNQSSDFPVRRTGSYRHKKALVLTKQIHMIGFGDLIVGCRLCKVPILIGLSADYK